MSFSLAPLLLHDDHVPAGARDALRAAHDAPPAERTHLLESAARILFVETDVDCGDARELVGLAGQGRCCQAW
jgi:hypothetical protein